MDSETLNACDLVLSRTARAPAPSGMSVVYVPRAFLLPYTFPVAPASPSQILYKQITGDTTWCLRAISLVTEGISLGGGEVLVQVQGPDGRFLENSPEVYALAQGYGSFRRVIEREKQFPAGSKITVTLIDVAAGLGHAVSGVFLFEGAYRYLVPKEAQRKDLVAAVSSLPRLVPGEPQNTLAPCWMWGQGPLTPIGYDDELYTYAFPLLTQDVTIVPMGTSATLALRWGETFECRRILFVVGGDRAATGRFLIRLRADSGYALMDDAFDAAGLIGASSMACDWSLASGERVYLDAQLVDIVPQSSGNMYLQCFLEGVRRRKKAA